jgi:DNA-binding MarR family transcriptional regulator
VDEPDMSQSGKQAPRYTDPTGEFPLDVTSYLFHLFAVLARHRDAELDRALKVCQLNTTRHRAISVIARLQPCTMRELSDFSAVDRTTMTRTVDQLVATGLIDRVTSASDRRQVLLTLTEQGQQAYRQALRIVHELNRRIVQQVPEDAQRAVARTKQRMVANLVDDPELAQRLLVFSAAGTTVEQQTRRR